MKNKTLSEFENQKDCLEWSSLIGTWVILPKLNLKEDDNDERK